MSPPEEDELLGHFYSESDDEISDKEVDDSIENHTSRTLNNRSISSVAAHMYRSFRRRGGVNKFL